MLWGDLQEADLEVVVRSAQVIITITSCFESLFPGEWVSPGHIAAMGTDTKGKQELDPSLTQSASLHR